MSKKYYYAVTLACLMIILGYYFDLQPQAAVLLRLQAQEKELFVRLLQEREKSKHQVSLARAKVGIEVSQKNSATLTDFVLLIERNGLQIQDATYQERANAVHFVLNGEFSSCIGLINALSKQSMPISLTRFSIKPMSGGLIRMVVDMTLPEMAARRMAIIAGTHPALMHSPFCNMKNNHVAEPLTNNDMKKLVSIRQMKMTGFLQVDQRLHALLLLPTNVTADVVVGDVVGSERGVVVGIRADGCDFMLTNKKIITLKYL
jgi:hypothetical protein